MEQELVQSAIRTFCASPKIYQQAFKQMGVEFPDELVAAITSNPKEAIKIIESDKNLLQGIVGIYQKYRKQIDEQTSMFKTGGKLGYLVNKF